MRRLALGFAVLALLGFGLGCRTGQFFLADLFFEAPLPAGVWTQISCFGFPVTPFEILGGDYYLQGDIELNGVAGPFPRRMLYMLQAYDSDMMRAGRPLRGGFRVNRQTGQFDAMLTLRDLVVPHGGYLCTSLKPKGKGLHEGQSLEYLNLQRLTEITAS